MKVDGCSSLPVRRSCSWKHLLVEWPILLHIWHLTWGVLELGDCLPLLGLWLFVKANDFVELKLWTKNSWMFQLGYVAYLGERLGPLRVSEVMSAKLTWSCWSTSKYWDWCSSILWCVINKFWNSSNDGDHECIERKEMKLRYLVYKPFTMWRIKSWYGTISPIVSQR